MKLKHVMLFVSRVTLLVTCLISWLSCSQDGEVFDDTPQKQQTSKVYTVTVDAAFDNGGVSRGLNNDYTMTWHEGDVVYVKNLTHTGSGSMTPQTTGNKSAVLKGTLTGSFVESDALELTYLKENVSYTGQKGTLNDIAQNYAFAKATVTVSSISGSTITTGAATFSNKQAIVEFKLLGEKGEAITASDLTVEGCGETVTVTGVSTSDIYVAMPGINNGPMKLTATVSGNTYSYETGHVTFDNGKHYVANVRMAKHESYDPSGKPLTFQALKDNTKVTFSNKSAGDVQYSYDNSNWTTISAGSSGEVSLSKAGDVVYFKGSNSTYLGTNASAISCDKACYVYGDIMSLAKDKTLELGAFFSLFSNNTNLRSHPTKQLYLSATTLSTSCYNSMFNGCSGLVRGPKFPSEMTYAENCFQYMFNNCSSLNYVEFLGAYDSNDFVGWLYGVASKGCFETSSGNLTGWNDYDFPSGWTKTGK